MRRRDFLEEDMEMEEEDIYTENGLEDCCDDDGISTLEEAFMKGYLGNDYNNKNRSY